MQALGGEGAGDRGYLRGRRGAEGAAVGEIRWVALGELRQRGYGYEGETWDHLGCSGAVSSMWLSILQLYWMTDTR